MQTFLPYSSFMKTAKCLDYRRLGKQRVEAYQLANIYMNGGSGGYSNHPAYHMWKNHIPALIEYGMIMCVEWEDRGYKDNLFEKFYDINSELSEPVIYPHFIGNEQLHSNHRACLLYKDYKWYSQFGWDEIPAKPLSNINGRITLPYIWIKT